MQNRNQSPDTSGRSTHTEDALVGKGEGPQGVDKAPGEEVAQNTEPVTQETQKGKKVDADPADRSGQPVRQDQ